VFAQLSTVRAADCLVNRVVEQLEVGRSPRIRSLGRRFEIRLAIRNSVVTA